MHGRWDIVQQPVSPGSGGSVGIIHNHSEASCPPRLTAPTERGSCVSAIAGVRFGDDATFRKCFQFEFESHIDPPVRYVARIVDGLETCSTNSAVLPGSAPRRAMSAWAITPSNCPLLSITRTRRI